RRHQARVHLAERLDLFGARVVTRRAGRSGGRGSVSTGTGWRPVRWLVLARRCPQAAHAGILACRQLRGSGIARKGGNAPPGRVSRVGSVASQPASPGRRWTLPRVRRRFRVGGTTTRGDAAISTDDTRINDRI